MERLAAASNTVPGTVFARSVRILAGGGVLLALALGLLAGLPAQAHAEEAGGFNIVATDGSALTEGTDYSYGNNTLSILSSKPVTVSMKSGQTTIDRIVVPKINTDANVTLADVDINLSDDYDACAFQIEPGARVYVTLAEGSKNSLVSGAYHAGLEVSRTGDTVASVVIDGEGSLTAKCVDYYGDFSVTAASGAGIGGSYREGSAGSIMIKGGTVVASCESNSGAQGAGIGCGYGGSGGDISIVDGTVVASCIGSTTFNSGIGGVGCTIEIRGGEVTSSCKATSFTTFGAGVGGSSCAVKISGGTVGVSCEGGGYASGAGIGGSIGGSGGTIAISGGRIAVRSSGDGAPIGDGANYSVDGPVDVSITGGLFGSANAAADVENNRVYGKSPVAGCRVFDSGDVNYPLAVSGLAGDFKVEGGSLGSDYSYDYAAGELSILTGEQLTLSMRDGIAQTARDRIVVPEGVAANVTLSDVDIDLGGDNDCAFQIVPGAKANVALADGSASSLVSGKNRAGLEVSRTGSAPDERIASVTISGAGSLTAKCVVSGANPYFAYGAGIGGGKGNSGGDIRIEDGEVTAVCEGSLADGAGIGGGHSGSGGDIDIAGGAVTAACRSADGSAYGAGIGGGSSGSGGSVRVTAGEVVATCESFEPSRGAGIGGGFGGSGGDIDIEGGAVTAACKSAGGVPCGAGIGGGDEGSGGNICITAGEVVATCEGARGYAYGAGIGGGWRGFGGTIAISGGRIKAQSVSGEDIGNGFSYSGDDAAVSITGGLFGSANAAADVENNRVYGRSPADGYRVFDNSDPVTQGIYPVAVDFATGDFKVDGGAWGTDYAFDRATRELSVLTNRSLTLSMREGVAQTTSDHILVPETNAYANITLAGVDVDVSGNESDCAFAIEPGANANITLVGDNSLVSGGHRAGLDVSRANDADFASATISGSGSLTAKCVSLTGNAQGAGIGGSGYAAAGKIAITGGEVTASCESSGKEYGAGIGGGLGSYGGDIAISGGRIKAQSGSEKKIGNGFDYRGDDAAVSITGGLFADGNTGDNKVYDVPLAEGRSVYGSGDADYPYAVGWTMDLQVEGGEPGVDYAYDYTTGVLSIDKEAPLTVSMREGVDVTVHNRIVVPEGVTANVTLAGVDIDQSGNHDGCAFRVVFGASANIMLAEGSENSLVSSSFRAGLEASGAFDDKPASVIVSGEGSLTAKCVNHAGSASAAGIGGPHGEPAGDITISGGTVNASCESNGDGGSIGAGIGGGSTAAGGKISITGGTVNASCKSDRDSFGAAIGGGIYGYGGTIAISGGCVTAQSGPGLAIGDGYDPVVGVPSVVSITGGLFGSDDASGDIAADSVYGVPVGAQMPACAVAPNPDDATAADYPVGVGKRVEYAPLLSANGDLAYTGAPLDASDFSLSAPETSLAESELKDAAMFSYGAEGSEPSIDGFPTEAGSYIVRATLPEKLLREDEGVYACYMVTKAAEADVAIKQAAASINLAVDKASCTYGDILAFTVAPDIARGANALRAVSQPTVEVFVIGPDGEEKVLGSGLVEEGKATTVSYDTAGKALAVGENVVCARVTGLPNLQDATEQVGVTLARKPVELAWEGLDGRSYKDGRQAAATATGTLPGDDVSVSVEGGGSERAGENTATGSLTGKHASFYSLPADKASATYEVAKAAALENVPGEATLTRLQPDASATVDVAKLLPSDAGLANAVYTVRSSTYPEGLTASVDPRTGLLALGANATERAQDDTVVVGIANMDNYADSTVAVTVRYTDKKAAIITGVNAVEGLAYTGAAQTGYAGTPTATYEGGTYAGDFAVSYVGAGQTVYGPSLEAPAGAGDYVATISVPSKVEACAGATSIAFSIAKAPLSVTANDSETTYGRDARHEGASYEGFVAGEGPDDLSGALAFSFGGYAPGSNAGTYQVEPSGLASDNYAISYRAGKLTVSPKALLAQVDAGSPSASRVYDGSAAFSGVALALGGALEGDEVSATADGNAVDALAGAGKAFAATRIVLAGSSAGNYALAPENVSGSVSIDRAPLIVRAKDATMVAGAALPAFGYETEGLAAVDEVLAPPAFGVEGDTSKAGTCAVVPSGISVTNAGCYDVVYEKGVLSVTTAGGNGGNGSSGSNGGDSTGGTPEPSPLPKELAPTGDPLAAAPLALGIAVALSSFAALLARRKVRGL